MKTALLLMLTTIILLNTSCEKEEDFLISRSDIPTWLKEQIQEDIKVIEADSMRMQNFGAWLRYEFNSEYYFEYDNPLSSLSRNPYSQEGIGIDIFQPPFTNYWKERCCGQYVWKGPKYRKIE